jgi:hypothetical protein
VLSGMRRCIVVLCGIGFGMDKVQQEVDKIMAGGYCCATVCDMLCRVTNGQCCGVWHATRCDGLVLHCSSSIDKAQPEVDKIMAGGVSSLLILVSHTFQHLHRTPALLSTSVQ